MTAPFRLAWRFYRTWLAAVFGYLLGCVLAADIVAKFANGRGVMRVDLRATGSGNPGGANALANLGRGWGIAVIAGDSAKGVLAAWAGRRLAGDAGAYAAATGAVAGHCFPAFSGFDGGKGVGTRAGTAAICFPAYLPFDLALSAVTYAGLRRPGPAMGLASTIFALAARHWHAHRWPNAWGPRPSLRLPLYALATSAMIIQKFVAAPPHMGNRGALDDAEALL